MVLDLFLPMRLVLCSSLLFFFVSIEFIVKIVEVSLVELLHGVLAHVTKWPDGHEPRLDISSDQRRLNLSQDLVMRQR
jgi:hypothetical protein